MMKSGKGCRTGPDLLWCSPNSTKCKSLTIRKHVARLLLFEHCSSLFVGEDSHLKLAEVGSFFRGDLDLANDVFAFVVEQVALRGNGGAVAGEIHVEVDGVGSFIDGVAVRQGDVEAVAPAAGRAQVDGNSARLVVKGNSVRTDHARTDEKQRARLVRVLGCRQLVVNFHGLIEGRRLYVLK